MRTKRIIKQFNKNIFLGLSFEEQLEALCCVDAKQKMNLLLDAANGMELVRQLPTQEVFLLAMERGSENTVEILSMASAEQWTGFFDLDSWDRDHFSPERARRWLGVLLENEEDQIFEILQGLNFDLLTLIIKSEVDILSGPEEIEDEDARSDALKRDGGYEIHYRSENVAKLYGKLFTVLQRFDLGFFVYLMEAVRGELYSMLEESVFQQRNSRLLDMGIPEPDKAKMIYAWVDPENFHREKNQKITPQPLVSTVPGFSLLLMRPEGLLAQILEEGLRDELAWEMTSVANKVMVADAVNFEDSTQVKAAISKVQVYLSLALEWGADGDTCLARELLDNCYLEELFRLGFSLTLKLKFRASRIQQNNIIDFLDPISKSCIDALMMHPPQYYEGVGNPLYATIRTFKTLDEVLSVQRWLDKIELQVKLFEKLPHLVLVAKKLDLTSCYPGELQEISLVEIFLTSLANKLLGRDFLPVPIEKNEIPPLHQMVSNSGVLQPRLRQETIKWVETLVPGAGLFAGNCLDIWEEEFCMVNLDEIEPKYLGGLILKLI
jgi:hypothetical protein